MVIVFTFFFTLRCLFQSEFSTKTMFGPTINLFSKLPSPPDTNTSAFGNWSIGDINGLCIKIWYIDLLCLRRIDLVIWGLVIYIVQPNLVGRCIRHPLIAILYKYIALLLTVYKPCALDKIGSTSRRLYWEIGSRLIRTFIIWK